MGKLGKNEECTTMNGNFTSTRVSCLHLKSNKYTAIKFPSIHSRVILNSKDVSLDIKYYIVSTYIYFIRCTIGRCKRSSMIDWSNDLQFSYNSAADREPLWLWAFLNRRRTLTASPGIGLLSYYPSGFVLSCVCVNKNFLPTKNRTYLAEGFLRKGYFFSFLKFRF